MIVNLSQQHSLISNWVGELRDVTIQSDRMRFRRNLERIGEVAAYEISKVLPFEESDNAFISAYRKHHKDGSFDISLDYVSCPELENRIVIISDPMLATGSSLVKTIHFLKDEGQPREIHIVAAIACTVGIEYVKREEPSVTIWCGDIDDELTAKGYIVPGLGDAGDLAYGPKMQM